MSSDKKPILNREALERVAEIFKLFGDATRLSILQALREGPRSVNDLVEELGMTQPNISKHLSQLRAGGLLSREKRGMQVFYSVDDDIIFPMCELVCGKLNRDSGVAKRYSFEI